MSKSYQKIVKKLSNFLSDLLIGQQVQLAKLPQSVHHRKTGLFVTFLLHKKALKSFLHSLTICDKVASGNNSIQ
jgi:hypothetical protein